MGGPRTCSGVRPSVFWRAWPGGCRPHIVDHGLPTLPPRHRQPGVGDTASSEVIAEATGCIGLCVETWMGFELDRRVAMQREVIEHLLKEAGVR